MTEPYSDLSLGEVIKAARKRKELTERQLAELSNVPRTTIQRIENGVVVRPRPDILHALGTALGIPIHELYELARYPTAQKLPSFAPYLRARYANLSPEATAKLERYFEELANREGIPLDAPNNGEDETR